MTQPVEKFCGFIMPISGMDNYPEEHWSRIKDILWEIANAAAGGLNICCEDPEVVSTDFSNPDVKSVIFDNLFSIPIVICDVSGNNPNVLYELGLRVAFDMPVIIIKDKRTKFSFDIASLLTIVYSDDLDLLSTDNESFQDFRYKLLNRIKSTYVDYKAGSLNVSPLGKYLHHNHYLQIKRGVPYDLAGQFEYKCYREENGYCHGGKCDITLRHSRGSVIEWHLKGERFWVRPDKDSEVQLFENPYTWDTTKAILFEDKTYFLSYEIDTGSLIIKGIIKGEVEVENNQVIRFGGYYYQDEGKQVLKGRFTMQRRFKDAGGIEFKLIPVKKNPAT
jgi:hypothetical protein